MSLEPLLSRIDPEGAIPPLEHWEPALCGDMDLLITADGRWVHEGTVISRPRLVRLLSTILRRETDGGYYLVSPQEKWRIRVEDRPFLAVDAEESQGVWTIVTNVGDWIELGSLHRFTLSELPNGDAIPEVLVRFGMAARLNRNLHYRLVECAESRQMPDGSELGVVSADVWQPLGRLDTDAS